MTYRIHGKEKTLAIGTLADVSPVKARKQRERARDQLADGQDPMEVKRLQNEAAKANAANSFNELA